MTTLPAGEPKRIIYGLMINAEPGPWTQSWVAASPFPSFAVGDYIAQFTLRSPSALKVRV